MVVSCFWHMELKNLSEVNTETAWAGCGQNDLVVISLGPGFFSVLTAKWQDP